MSSTCPSNIPHYLFYIRLHSTIPPYYLFIPPYYLYIPQVLATVSSATTSMMSLLNTSSSIVHYMTLQEVDYGYAAWGFGIGAAGG